jgi:hypothetical protein
MAKLQKAQLGKIVKTVAKKAIAPVIKKRSWENVSGAAATVGAGTAGTAAYYLGKARKELADTTAVKKKSGGQGPANKIGKMVKISKKMK